MTTTYAVITQNGDLVGAELTQTEAAQAILNHDGQDYEIRNDSDALGFTLWSRQQVANRPWHATVIYSGESDKAKAEAEIFAKVIAANWDGQPFATTMQAYEEMNRENNA
jgi:hypothetical protein